MYILVLIRHGQSAWNKENRFTGWTDVPLSDLGKEEAQNAGKMLQEKGFVFDTAYTSFLRRASDTLDLVLEQMQSTNIPIVRTWRLNERHYGALQGLNKAETAEKYGAEQVHIWRRSFDVAPPALEPDDERAPGHDPKYAKLRPEECPLTESLKDTIARMLPFIEQTLLPAIKNAKKIIVAAHGNSLRALVKYLEKISDADIPKVEIPTGIPLIYELDDDLKVMRKYYLND